MILFLFHAFSAEDAKGTREDREDGRVREQGGTADGNFDKGEAVQ